MDGNLRHVKTEVDSPRAPPSLGFGKLARWRFAQSRFCPSESPPQARGVALCHFRYYAYEVGLR